MASMSAMPTIPVFWPSRRWRVLRGTPLAPLAEALVKRGSLHQKLAELGLTAASAEHRASLHDCGFDTQNHWHWLDVAPDPGVRDAWLDGGNQRRVRDLLQAPLLLFKPTGDVIRIWFPTRRYRNLATGQSRWARLIRARH